MGLKTGMCQNICAKLHNAAWCLCESCSPRALFWTLEWINMKKIRSKTKKNETIQETKKKLYFNSVMKPDLVSLREPFNDLSLTHLDIVGEFFGNPHGGNNWRSGSWAYESYVMMLRKSRVLHALKLATMWYIFHFYDGIMWRKIINRKISHSSSRKLGARASHDDVVWMRILIGNAFISDVRKFNLIL